MKGTLPKYTQQERDFANKVFPELEDAEIIVRTWGAPPKKKGSELMQIAFPGTSACQSRVCPVPPWLGSTNSTLKCPAPNLWLRDGKKFSPNETTDYTQVAGCLSNCTLYNTDYACCRGQYASPTTCTASSPALELACPEAYTYAFDDSVFYQTGNVLQSCVLNSTQSYMEVTFCCSVFEIVTSRTYYRASI